jgi:multiple sugar transport system substrate-binding protein
MPEDRQTAITGVGWGHRRCWGPLEASIKPYQEQSGVDIRWDRRSLFSFGEGDLSEFTGRYDLIVFDHPFVGEVAAEGHLLDLNAFLTAADRERFASDSVGQSWPSYRYDGGVWALPIDAAAITAAWRPDLMDRHDFDTPATLEDVFTLAERARAAGMWVAWPSKPTDLMCTLMSVSASLGLSAGAGGDAFLESGATLKIIELLKRLATSVHPMSEGWNPIKCLDYMAANDDVVYVPYTFNYVNYATHSQRPIRFGTSPRVEPGQAARGLLGGAGIGISAHCSAPQAAFDYANYLCSAKVQSSYYVGEGGQPASRSAWNSRACNQTTNGFFDDTLPALDNAYLRPTHNGFIQFFHRATLDLAEVVHGDAPAKPFVDWLNAAYDRLRTNKTQIESVS